MILPYSNFAKNVLENNYNVHFNNNTGLKLLNT
jgi:hypothetical protein